MAFRRQKNNAYGLRNSIQDIFPEPIVANRAPTAGDRSEIGTMWVNTAGDSVLVITSIVANSATWTSLGGTSDTIANLTVTASFDQTGGTFDYAGTTFDVNATGLISLDSSAGAISLDAAVASNFSVSGAGIDLTMASAAGRVIVNGEEAAANAITLLTAAGGIDADAALQINIDSSQAAATAIVIQASNAAGGIDVNSGTGGMALDSTGNTNFTSTANTANAVVIDGNGGTTTAVTIQNQTGTGVGSIAIASTAGGIVTQSGLDAIDSILIEAAGGTSEAIRISSSAGTTIGSVELESVAGGVLVTSAALAATTGLHIAQGAETVALQVGTGVPSHNAPKGSLYMRTDGSSTSTRAYVATDAVGTWTNLTTAA